MLVTSMVVLAIVASAYAFVPSFSDGVNTLGSDASQMLQTGSIVGVRSLGEDIDGGVTPQHNRNTPDTWIEAFLDWWDWS